MKAEDIITQLLLCFIVASVLLLLGLWLLNIYVLR